jgi:hypothetical protein
LEKRSHGKFKSLRRCGIWRQFEKQYAENLGAGQASYLSYKYRKCMS